MKKCLLGVVLVANLLSSTVFAQQACPLDTMGRTFKVMENSELSGSAIIFRSDDSNVKKVLQDIQKEYCENSDKITVSTYEGIVKVVSTSTKNPYMFFSWYKNGEIVSTQLQGI